MTAIMAESVLDYPEPARRALQIYAVDPMMSRLSGNEVVTITVPYEPLGLGPAGELVQVVDYDVSRGVYYAPVDLDDPALLVQNGLAPSEQDPRFHQQMCYGVVSSLLENFERGLGRRFRWRGWGGTAAGSGSRLLVFPHAFVGENAIYDPSGGGSLRFGYFRSDPIEPGRNLPGQFVFSCLSHDIIVHEATHALVDRLRPWYKEATNLDVFAFHEGYADAVALFQHFALPDLLSRYIQVNRADLTAKSPMVELAQQFGESTGRGRALRTALGDEPDPAKLATTLEPHARGAIFVAAVFDAFFATYQAAIADLLRLATAGTGILAPGALHPDLVARVATEARRVAQRFLTMLTRVFQYLPPVDVTFGDFLRSAVSADRDMNSVDELGMRAALVEAFRKRGIFPMGVSGLADEAVALPTLRNGLPPLDVTTIVEPLVFETAMGYRARRGVGAPPEGPEVANRGAVEWALREYGKANAAALGLNPALDVRVSGFHAAFRMGSSGLLRVNVVVQFHQMAAKDVQAASRERLGGVVLRGGATLVADVNGEVRHVVSKATPEAAVAGATDAGVARMAAIAGFVDAFDSMDLPGPWRWDTPDARYPSPAYRNGFTGRVAASMTIGHLDAGVPW